MALCHASLPLLLGLFTHVFGVLGGSRKVFLDVIIVGGENYGNWISLFFTLRVHLLFQEYIIATRYFKATITVLLRQPVLAGKMLVPMFVGHCGCLGACL